MKMGLNPGALAVLTILLVMPTVAWADADADFASRCAAVGVVKCEGFESVDSRWHPVSGRMSVDPAVKVSGEGALKFFLPGNAAVADIAGNWADDLGLSIQTGTMYAQYRLRLTPSMLTNNWDSSWKVSLFHGHNSTCQPVEITTVNSYMSGRISMYGDCGGWSAYTTPGTFNWTGTTPQVQQQGSMAGWAFPDCEYNSFTDCVLFTPDEWITLYYKFVRGASSTQVQAWKSVGGEPYVQFINVADAPLGSGGDPIDRIMLTPYMPRCGSTN
jgi:hypothetical protein